MAELRARMIIYEDPAGSAIHRCFIKKCSKRPVVFFRASRKGSKEDWIPTCQEHVSKVAGLVATILLTPDDGDPDQPSLFGDGETKNGK